MSQWIDFFLLKRQKVEIIPNQISGHYIVYKSDANERDESKNYAVKNGVFVPQGTEVTKESEVSVGRAEVWKIKSVDDGKEYWTTGTNLMEIKVLTTPEEVTLECGYSVQLPYTSNATTTKPTNGLKCTKIATCGEDNDIYFRVSSSELPEFGTSTNSKGYWCFDWRTKPHLTASEIAAVRTVIQSESDATKKGDDFLLLQEKVPYHNQRDNVSTATQVDINLNSWITSTSQTIGDIMCNLTSEVMALEYLGLSKDSCVDDRCSANCTQAQFEDFLECQIRENGFARRNEPTSRESLASLFGVTQTTYTKEGWNESFEKKFSWSYDAFSGIRDEIRNGLGVIMSVFGHIVRIQSISEDGITVDDPYGSVTYWSASGATPKYKNSTEDHRNSKTSTSEDQEGNNCLWLWSDLSNNSISFNRIEAYSK